MRDEAQLIRAAARGDVQSFEQLILLKRERVVRTAYQITGDIEDARDVAQGVFVSLWKSLNRFDPGKRFDTWLYRITVNAAIDHLRKTGPKGMMQPLPGGGSGDVLRTSSSADRTLSRIDIQRAFLRLAPRLAPKQRAVFVMREIQGLETAEVARVMEITESTVRNHLFQARRILRTGLIDEYPDLVPGGMDAGGDS